MKVLVVGLWEENKLTEYRASGHDITEKAEISLDELNSRKRKKRFLESRILIIGRTHSAWMKRCFPKAESNKLKKMIEFDVLQLAQGEDVAFWYQIHESKKEKIWVDVWMWDKKKVEKIVHYFHPHSVISG